LIVKIHAKNAKRVYSPAGASPYTAVASIRLQHWLTCSRPEGPRAGVGFLERGQPAPSPPVRGSGERCKLPQWGPGRSPGRQTILPHLTGQDGLS